MYTYSRKDWKHKSIDTKRQSSHHDTVSIITPRKESMKWCLGIVTLALSLMTEVACSSSKHACEAQDVQKENVLNTCIAMFAEALEAARPSAMYTEDRILHAPTLQITANDAARYLLEAVGCLYISLVISIPFFDSVFALCGQAVIDEAWKAWMGNPKDLMEYLARLIIGFMLAPFFIIVQMIVQILIVFAAITTMVHLESIVRKAM